MVVITRASIGCHVWNVDSGKLLRAFKKSERPFFGPKGDFLVFVGERNLVQVSDAFTSRRVFSLQLPEGGKESFVKRSLRLTNDRKTLAFLIRNGSENDACVIDTVTGKIINRFCIEAMYPLPIRMCHIAISNDGSMLFASIFLSPDILVFDIKTGELQKKLKHREPAGISSLFVTRDGSALAAHRFGNQIAVWSIPKLEKQHQISSANLVYRTTGDSSLLKTGKNTVFGFTTICRVRSVESSLQEASPTRA